MQPTHASTDVNMSAYTGTVPTDLPVLPDLASCCSPASGGRIDDEAAAALARMFKALSDPTRVKLLSMIAAADGQEACVCDLTAPVGLSQPTVSHHMKVLTEAGLVEREQRGRWAYFGLVPGVLESLAGALAPRR